MCPSVSNLEEKMILLKFLPLELLLPEAVGFENPPSLPPCVPGGLELQCAAKGISGPPVTKSAWPLTAGDIICLIYVTGRVL